MNKRGQIYILAAIIVCMVAFLLVSKPNLIREQVLLQNFKGISNNYLTESPKVINHVLESETYDLEGIKSKLSGFTGDFVDNYAKNQDPNIGLIYIYNDKNGLVVQNYLDDQNIEFEGQTGGEVLLNYNENVGGTISFEGTGVENAIGTPLCDIDGRYCIIERTTQTSGTYTLKIGNISYEFDITPESPELIVIIRSKDENTVKVDVSESKL